MRITTVIAGLGGGGAERVCVNLANAWAEAGGQVTLLTITQNSTGSTYALDPRVERRDVGWPRVAQPGEDSRPILAALRQEDCLELAGELSLLAALRKDITATAPDVVVSHMDLTNMRVLAAMHDSAIPLIACEHTDPNRVSLGPWSHAREVLHRRATAVIASHPNTVDWFARRGIAARCIPNPLVPPPPRSAAKNGRRTVITIGRLAPEKRVEMLLRAFARIANDFPEWNLEIYGTGPLEEKLASLLPERARLRGFTDDPYGALSAADLYVSASCVEGFGNAIWEALACGLPVIAMECGEPVRTLVRDGIDGRIIAGGELDLALAMAQLMRGDETRKAFGARASEAVERYSMEAALRAWDAVFAEVGRTVNA